MSQPVAASVLQSDEAPQLLDLCANGGSSSGSGGGGCGVVGENTIVPNPPHHHLYHHPTSTSTSTSLTPLTPSYASIEVGTYTTMAYIDIWPAVITGDLNFLVNNVIIMHDDSYTDYKPISANGSRFKNNIDIHKRDKNGDTPILYASIDGREDIVRWLLCHGSNPNDKRLEKAHAAGLFRYETPLMRAARYGHVHVIKALLEHEDTYVSEQKHDSGDTALHLAAEAGYSNVVSLLLDSKKCNPEVRNLNGATAMSIASNFGQLNVVKTLLSHPIMPANSLVTDNRQRTPLYLAAVEGHKNVIDLLLVEGNASPLDRDIQGVFAILLAASSHRRSIVQVLNKWAISMGILCLRELSLFYHLDMSSVLDLDEYLGDLELLVLR